jgi:hypothetical protein
MCVFWRCLPDEFADVQSGALERESKDVFRDVMLRQAHLVKIPVHVEVAQTHIRINAVSYNSQ